MMNWSKSRKGCADIYTAPGIDRAVVDRRGFGMGSSSLGSGITYAGQSFISVESAKKYAEEHPHD